MRECLALLNYMMNSLIGSIAECTLCRAPVWISYDFAHLLGNCSRSGTCYSDRTRYIRASGYANSNTRHCKNGRCVLCYKYTGRKEWPNT